MRGMPRRQRFERARALIASVGFARLRKSSAGPAVGRHAPARGAARALIMERPIR